MVLTLFYVLRIQWWPGIDPCSGSWHSKQIANDIVSKKVVSGMEKKETGEGERVVLGQGGPRWQHNLNKDLTYLMLWQ